MNVLIIGMDPSAASGNKGKSIGDLQDRLLEYGKDLTNLYLVSYTPDDGRFSKRKFSNVSVIPTRSKTRLSFIRDGYGIASNIIKREKIDLITTQDPLFSGIVGYALKKKNRIPLVVQIHGDYVDNRFWVKRKFNILLNTIAKYIVRRADGVRVVGQRVKHKMVALGIPEEKISVIPVFINIEKFIKVGSPEIKEKYSAYRHIVLFVGRLSFEKNIENLLNSALIVLKEFPDTLFLIVGDGPEKHRLMEATKKLGIRDNVIFEGAVEHDRIIEYYHACDLLALPSNYEGWGLVLIEALACGKPVVTTDVGCANEVVIDGKNGYVVPVSDPIRLGEGITRLLNDPHMRIKMGMAGRTYVLKTQDIKKNAHELKEMYEKVVGEFGA